MLYPLSYTSPIFGVAEGFEPSTLGLAYPFCVAVRVLKWSEMRDSNPRGLRICSQSRPGTRLRSNLRNCNILEPWVGIEPTTPSLPRKSTSTMLPRRWSQRRESNSWCLCSSLRRKCCRRWTTLAFNQIVFPITRQVEHYSNLPCVGRPQNHDVRVHNVTSSRRQVWENPKIHLRPFRKFWKSVDKLFIRHVHCLICFGAGCRNRTDGNSSLQMRRSRRCANPAIIIVGVAGNRTQVRDISVQAFSTSVFYCCLNCRPNRNPTTIEELSVRHLC